MKEKKSEIAIYQLVYKGELLRYPTTAFCSETIEQVIGDDRRGEKK